MKVAYLLAASARRDYYTLLAGIKAQCPLVLKDPIMAAAAAQIEVAELALSARLDQLTDSGDDE